MDQDTFSFGKNWQRFLSCINEERLATARASLVEFLEKPNLENLTFLDVGCGSGLFSNAAFHLKAKRIVSFDVDPFSVRCCEHLHAKVDKPSHWQIQQGSILDPQLLSSLGQFDIVYSWGVLHHTGQMWDAIQNSAGLVKRGGFYYIAIYNTVDGILGSRFWLKIKKFYNRSPQFVQWLLVNIYCLALIVRCLLNFQNPLSFIRNYKSLRGMSFKTDAVDWVGGYPYEFASIEEIFRFMKSNFPKFTLVNVKSTNNFGNNWFLFRNDA